MKVQLSFLKNLLFLLWAQISFAQSQSSSREKLKKLLNADANAAIEITDSIFGPVNVSLGYGAKKEFTSKEKGTELCMEDNSSWFKFTIDHDTILTFDIVPIDSLDDYDFVLFKCPDTNCIDTRGNNNFTKIRSCWSICTSKSGMTGLSEYSRDVDIYGGLGPAYVSAIPVKAGETYYLMVNCSGQVYINKGRHPLGFYIYFYNYFPKRKPIVLNNIFFETGKSVLQKESFPELDKLAGLLRASQMVIEVRGHTDNVGDKKKNLLLSEERAKAVVDYLISKKIDKKRLFYKGFGDENPVVSNATQEGRQKNRRVEFIKVVY